MELNTNDLADILNEATRLSQISEFEKKVNSRDFETEITNIASSYIVNESIYKSLLEEIENFYDGNKKKAVVLFFVLFTLCRRQNYGDILELANNYDEMFSDYAIMKHIMLMAVLGKCTNTSKIYREIRKFTPFVKSKTETYDFTQHTGVLNAYCSLVCKYFEYELDERNESENSELLKFALACIEKAIEIETREKGDPDEVYNKFYLNRGRCLVLLKNYDKGEAEILRSIELLPPSADRSSKVHEYNQHLMKASIIRSYDLNEEKVHDLDKIKVSNYKSLALMTTLLGFLLGTINIFTTVTDRFTLLMLMLGYFGLLVMLSGTILIGFSLNFKEQKRRFYVYDAILMIVGAGIFVCALILII